MAHAPFAFAGRDRNQIKLYNIETGEEIDTGGRGVKMAEQEGKLTRVRIPWFRHGEMSSRAFAEKFADYVDEQRETEGLPPMPKTEAERLEREAAAKAVGNKLPPTTGGKGGVT